MAVDMQIHVFEGVTLVDLSHFMDVGVEDPNPNPTAAWREAVQHVSDTPNIWVGECSWNGNEVPEAIRLVDDLLGHGPVVVTMDLVHTISMAMLLPNATSYRVAKRGTVHKWLKKHLGKQIFAIGW